MLETRAGGGAWLFDSAPSDAVFTPERISDEHRLIRQTADEFVQQEVHAHLDRLESKDWTLVRELVRKCADLGLIGTDVPEEYGGTALDKVSSLIIGESVGAIPSWGVTFGGQTGLSITPLVCFGTPEQKSRYLPRLASGEIVGAYALSETGSGSDALSARCRATRQPDGSFRLTGEKMWITNGGFADLFTVFAKIDGEQFTAFLVERAFGGVSTGNEEHKMGLHGSSTTPLLLQDVHVPAGNLLGQPGKGHKVAFNVLNYGRFKLGAMCSGNARVVIADAAKYAAERRQFGRPIAEFGAIRYKLSEMCVRQYAVESMLYRMAGALDDAVAAGAEIVAALEELAVEASIIKVAGSEMLDYVVDENVQIHGGNGFVRDYAAERHYRDARVNRIFEGTNEINRTIIPGMLARRFGPELQRGDAARAESDPIRFACQLVLATAIEKYGSKLSDEQELLMLLADVLIEGFACDTVSARAAAARDPLHEAAARVYVNDALRRVEIGARHALAIMDAGDRLPALQQAMASPPVNTLEDRRRIAGAAVSRRKYPFA